MALAESQTNKKNLLNETKLFPEIRVYYNGYDPGIEKATDPQIINHLADIKKSHFIVGIIARIEIQKRIDISLKYCKKNSQ